LAIRIASAWISSARSAAAVSVVKNGLPVPDLGDRDRALHPRVHAEALERVLQRERVEHRGQHAHVVAGRAVHALRGGLHAAEDVAGALHDGDLDAAIVHALDLGGDRLDALGVGAVFQIAHQRLPGQLEEDALEGGWRHGR
jgi:hypothetical protein